MGTCPHHPGNKDEDMSTVTRGMMQTMSSIIRGKKLGIYPHHHGDKDEGMFTVTRGMM